MTPPLLGLFCLSVKFGSCSASFFTGDEVFESKLIAKRYLKGRFAIDLLASLPLDFVSLVSSLTFSYFLRTM